MKGHKKIISLGLMSGTSMDGIDAVLVESVKDKDRILLHKHYNYAPQLSKKLIHLIKKPAAKLNQLTELNQAVGQAFANAAEKTIKASRIPRHKITVIGSHGQTVFHNPQEHISIQLGEPTIIAEKTGITTVSDFRAADLAAGGEGAPLIPYYHVRMLKQRGLKNTALHNLGGISNFTYLGNDNSIIATDTGPANCMLDLAIQHFSKGKIKYDKAGKLAAKGKVQGKALTSLLENPDVCEFRKRNFPKSTGRELFGHKLFTFFLKNKISQEDALATLCAFSVELMAEAYEKTVFEKSHRLDEVVFMGGGAHNKILLKMFHERLPQIKYIKTAADYDLHAQAIEAKAFAVYAVLALQGIAINIPSVTGAKHPVVCGKITYAK